MAVDPAHLETHRTALTGHCYRMLGSIVDAEDAVQETHVRAWRSLDRFQERASLRTWLYRIATNVCLDALSERARRARPMEEAPPRTLNDALHTRPRTHWLERVPDARVLPADADPFERTVQRQSIRLAFVAACRLGWSHCNFWRPDPRDQTRRRHGDGNSAASRGVWTDVR